MSGSDRHQVVADSRRSRRRFLHGATSLGAMTVAGWPLLERVLGGPAWAGAGFGDDDPFAGGTHVTNLEFRDRRDDRAPRERATGRGLNGRYRKDLSTLTPDTLVTPNDAFFIRTRCPDRIDFERPWVIRVDGLVERPLDLPLASIRARAEDMGVHLVECAGSGVAGLISAAGWTGVPLTDVLRLDGIDVKPKATRVLVSGFDDHSRYDRGYDERGADWIFTLDEVRRAGAFLATGMNGEDLPRDHGHPVRLVVPGWYGCTCIKWVDRIDLVDDTARATRHMRQYARRTHQDGVPRRARDYQPAEIDLTAMPVRVEQWRVDDRTIYRVVGIIWGGRKTTDDLAIRFGRDETYVPVDHLRHTTNRTWSLWSHVWRPRRPGRYRIQLEVHDERIRTRRLDRGWYAREVEVTEV